MTWLLPVWAKTDAWSLLSRSTTAPLLGAGVLLTVCLLCLLPSGRPVGRWRQLVAVVSGVAGLVGLWTMIPSVGTPSAAASFWALSALTLGAALATISARSPVYSAIWFAVSLLGTAALFLLQGAQFVSLATVAVYAGAIVVTFLFVLMLAQPEGHAFYDRISRGFPTRLVATLTAVSLAVIVAASLAPADSQKLALGIEAQENLIQPVEDDVLAPQHMAHLGSRLFTRHLIAVEVAGTLLLVALVGAIAMVSRDATGQDHQTRDHA